MFLVQYSERSTESAAKVSSEVTDLTNNTKQYLRTVTENMHLLAFRYILYMMRTLVLKRLVQLPADNSSSKESGLYTNTIYLPGDKVRIHTVYQTGNKALILHI